MSQILTSCILRSNGAALNLSSFVPSDLANAKITNPSPGSFVLEVGSAKYLLKDHMFIENAEQSLFGSKSVKGRFTLETAKELCKVLVHWGETSRATHGSVAAKFGGTGQAIDVASISIKCNIVASDFEEHDLDLLPDEARLMIGGRSVAAHVLRDVVQMVFAQYSPTRPSKKSKLGVSYETFENRVRQLPPMQPIALAELPESIFEDVRESEKETFLGTLKTKNKTAIMSAGGIEFILPASMTHSDTSL